ncbi:gamma-glutamyl-gamma-aminobutyrate hydrolase [Sinobacterium caligoides]|uniref:gamma-glutamyl-gamma-aminobutyrate hydrolase n=1 Tax=Sinobacterium caligoides TaxID=933926 RepID=A0A3N2DJY6_9GAMM|nr:gamma-glutamyl-gamma-aminobutyrate hydrolase family protein [Sinobacterium caligoides]ROS00096.1 gamma-glutamyl-gamma-aminobutyrate hydrolase [Sinobacterium caligoides]
MSTAEKPLVLVCADRQQVGVHPFHMAGEKYIKAVIEGAGAIPLVLPALPHSEDIVALLSRVDGVLLTGAYANIEPHHYGADEAPENELKDPARDAATLPLIPQLVAQEVPILGICRGFQEINVAYGGSLFHRVHENEGFFDHREDGNKSLDEQYAPLHPVDVAPGGCLRNVVGTDRFMVNSLHGQGIERLGEGLTVEARAEDGLVEAISVTDAKAFTLAVQWHPEWKLAEHKAYADIFRAFGDACRQRLSQRVKS